MNTKQKVDLIRTLLETREGSVYDGIQASRYFSERWGINEDWHLYTEIMEEMSLCRAACVVERGGYTKYMIGFVK
jgi:hypothetical protein